MLLAELARQLITGKEPYRPTPEISGPPPQFFPDAKKFFTDGIKGAGAKDLANACFQAAIKPGDIVNVVVHISDGRNTTLVSKALVYEYYKTWNEGNDVSHFFGEVVNGIMVNRHHLIHFGEWEKVEVAEV
jgi:hypothetical protein